MLKNYDNDFSRGLTGFFRPNGEGKTTLAAFFRAMLYGMDDVKSKTKNNPRPFCERIHYYPFEGGKYGGSLEIEAQGKRWRIERYFDAKKSTGDSVKLLCDNAETDLPKNSGIGEMILGIDKASFERTLFIDRTDLEISASGSIGAKLNDIVEDGGSDFERALSDTETLLKAIKDGRGNVNKSKIKLLNEKTDKIDTQLANANVIAESLKTMYAGRNKLAADIEVLQQKADKAAKTEAVRGYWNTYDGYLNDAKERRERAENLKKGYANGIPAEAELKALENCAAKDIDISARERNARLSEEDVSELERLKKVFESGIPDRETLEEKKQNAQRIKILENQLDKAKGHIPARYETELVRHFESGAPDDADIEKMQAFADKARALRKEYEQAKNTEPEQIKQSSRALPWGIAAVILVIAGIVVLAAVNKIFGAVLIAAGFALAIAAVAADFSARLNRLENTRENAALKAIEDEINSCAQQLAGFNARYGYISENGAVYDFEQLKKDSAEYIEIKTQLETEEKERENLRTEYAELQKKLDEFFVLYGIKNDDKTQAYEELTDEIKAFAALEKKAADCSKAAAEITAEKTENDCIKNGIIGKYALDISDGIAPAVTLARKIAAEIESNINTAKDFTEKAEKLKLEKQLTTRPKGEENAVDEIQSELKTKLSELATLDRQIDDAEPEAAAIPELEEQRADCEEKKAEYEQMYSLYKKVGEYFALAEKNLKDRYIDPVKNSYITYASALEEALGEKIEMDREYHIMFEKNGEYRSEKHLSAGQLCMCALCFRLALTDNMFKGEKPFVIMDDPFADLDREHMQKAAELVKKLAADRQIIYFCCHDSRIIG